MVDLVTALTSKRNVNEREQPEDELNYSPANNAADYSQDEKYSAEIIIWVEHHSASILMPASRIAATTFFLHNKI